MTFSLLLKALNALKASDSETNQQNRFKSAKHHRLKTRPKSSPKRVRSQNDHDDDDNDALTQSPAAAAVAGQRARSEQRRPAGGCGRQIGAREHCELDHLAEIVSEPSGPSAPPEPTAARALARHATRALRQTALSSALILHEGRRRRFERDDGQLGETRVGLATRWPNDQVSVSRVVARE